MARKTPKRPAKKALRKAARKPAKKAAKKPAKRSVRESLKKARTGKAAKVKGPNTRAAADHEAEIGAMPQWTPAEVEEAFRRFQAAMPAPETELEHVDPYTLLIAVV